MEPSVASADLEGGHSKGGSGNDGIVQDAVLEPSSGVHIQLYAVDELVEVMRRAWIGINKPGGVGKIVRFHEDTGLYDVSYVLGGRERNVEARYISRVAFLDRTVKRDTLGRCRYLFFLVLMLSFYNVRLTVKCIYFGDSQAAGLSMFHQRLRTHTAGGGNR
jgi:hypothetical protein